MKALQATQPGTFSTVQVPNPVLDQNRGNYILVKTAWVTTCGSDMPFFYGRKPNLPYPLQSGFPAHECAGQVIQSTSPAYQPGDWVVAMPDESRGLAEYFLAQTARSVRLAEPLAGQADSPLIQPLATVVNAVDRLGDLEGLTVCVVGLGSIGLMFCWLLKKRGAASVIGIDPIASRCDASKDFGADRALSLSSAEYLQDLDAGKETTIDICIEAVGHQMQTINDCLRIVDYRGTVLAFGVPDQETYSLDYETFFRKNISLVAVVTPNWVDYLVRAHDLYLENRGLFSRLITHQLPIQEAEHAFKIYADHADGVIKAAIDLSPWENSNGFKKTGKS